ncbi:tetraspanin-2a [Kryptolebias marmoratus]|uniref:Tetraspanin n=1 Tax=Kryptolebias marmoratus TaxID=37003 RepID=A0A3Q3AUX1_KRYMA|nr:tetraspanin-2a [Kryptolebias marmoratus]
MSKVQGGMKCVKYLLFVFNFIFWLSGLLVLGVGLWLRFDQHTVDLLTGDGAPDTFFIAVYILLGAGGLMMIVGFFGCFGAVRESQCLLASFFACLLIIFGAEITAGVFGFMNREEITEEVKRFYNYSVDENNPNGTAIAILYHNTLNCCGSPTTGVIEKLCPEAAEDTQDCFAAIQEFFEKKLYIIGYIGIGIAGVMILGMVFSMVLCCAIRNTREVI